MKRAILLLAVTSCSSRVDVLDSTSSDTTSGTSTTSTTTDASTSTTGPITGADDATSYNIINEPDLGPYAWECDLWSQDCPPGEKCMPYADDGGGAWNSARCSPVVPDPKQPGEACTVSDSAVSGLDDCGYGSMCWYVDPDTNIGECVEMCLGSEGSPICNEPCSACVIAAENVLILCMPNCDPLVQTCREGQACYPIVEAFACAPDVSGRTGALGDACEFINVCDPGLFCADPGLVPDCDHSGCCTPFCDLDGPDECDSQLPGTACVPWSDEGAMVEACIASGTVGYCGVPR